VPRVLSSPALKLQLNEMLSTAQAAQKVIAEMQRIPMPSPRKAGAPQHENPAESGEDASHEDRSLEPSQENVSKPVESKPEPQYADHGKDFAGVPLPISCTLICIHIHSSLNSKSLILM